MSCPRRDVLRAGAGAGLGLLGLLGGSAFASLGARSDPLAPLAPHFDGPAKRVIFLFMFGGPSQMDLFDYKPELQRLDGQTIEMERRRNQLRTSKLLGSARAFKQWGETGQWCSDAFVHLPHHMDKLAVIKSLHTDSFAHGSAVLQMNSGQRLQGHPAMGAWVTRGLGTENPDLPAFVVMHDPRGGPISGPANWTSGYMPAAYQGTLFRSTGDPLLHMSPTPASDRVDWTRAMEREQIDLLRALNEQHAASRAGSSESAARADSYDLAFRMQVTAPEALDLDQEDERTQRMYGLFDPVPDHSLAVGPAVFGRQCLIARRLIERGVRFVQIYHGGGHQQQTWDAHLGVEENLAIHCPEVDRPIAGLLQDLEDRGLLDETLVVWGGEFGRQPVSQLAGNGQEASAIGRDHNPKAFTMWLAGAGVKPGSYGETDDIGAEAAVNRHHIRDPARDDPAPDGPALRRAHVPLRRTRPQAHRCHRAAAHRGHPRLGARAFLPLSRQLRRGAVIADPPHAQRGQRPHLRLDGPRCLATTMEVPTAPEHGVGPLDS